MSAAEELRAPPDAGAALTAPPTLPATTPASPPLSPRRGRPRWVRILATAFCFGVFFGGTTVLGVLASLWFRVSRGREEDRARFTRKLNQSLMLFAGLIRDLGVIDFWPPRLPPGYEGEAYLLVANHPSLIDVVLVLAAFPELSAVAKASWYRSFLMGPLLRRTHLIPGPGFEGDEEGEDDLPVVRRMEESLRSGVPVLVFPEGTRSAPDGLRRFRRGGFEAAVRAGVPILPLFIAPDIPFLVKGVPFWATVRSQTCGYEFEWLEPVDPQGKTARQIANDLSARYQARFARLLASRRARGA